MITEKSSRLLAAACNLMNKNFIRSYYKEPFFYEQKYFGKFDYQDQAKYPRKLSSYKEEELLDEIHAIRAIALENPSPFHVVRRVKTMCQLPWTQKVTLRRLNLHSSFNGECVIVPNTPRFNAMLDKVKHLLQLKPAKFPDGRIPTEDDIGALKICPYTGNIVIDEKLRLQSKRLCPERPLVFQGNHLRYKINRLVGMHTMS